MRLRLFLLNLLLAVLWTLMWGQIDLHALLFGFALGFLLLALAGRAEGAGYGRRVLGAIRFGAYFLKILIKSNLQVAREICTPGLGMTPGILRYDVSGLTELQITSLANSITLTPGTLSLDLSDDNRHLYVHCMYAADRAAAVRDLDELRDRLMQEIFR